MCGIVGYNGTTNAVEPILEGLSRLEYRGYDSAGLCLKTSAGWEEYKREGKIENLKGLLAESQPSGFLGIGHTRWATHGRVNDTNAHPHVNQHFAIVHNGIIENASELKKQLDDYDFVSETDSEVFLACLTKNFLQVNDVKKAIVITFKEVEGNSAFLIMHKDQNHMYAIKRSAPLVCGVGVNGNELFVSSDPYALVGFTSNIYFPGDGVLCESSEARDGFNFYDLELKSSKDYETQQAQTNNVVVNKGKFEHFMLKEIFEQPQLLLNTARSYSQGNQSRTLKSIVESNPDMVHIIGCGTALHAGLVIKNFLEMRNGIRVNSDFASEFRYKNPIINPENEIGIFITQSGETADTLACQELCKENGLKTVGLVNVEGSTIFRSCDENILIHAGTEIGVASTKAFTQMVVMGYLLSSELNPKFEKSKVVEEIEAVAEAIDKILAKQDKIKAIAGEIYNYKGFIFTGRREQYPIALEGALKLKEIAYVHAEGYAAGELKHGPIALFDESMVNIAIVTNDLFKKTLSNAQEVKARKGVMVILGEQEQPELREIADFYIDIDYCGATDLKPIVSNVVLQLLSYHIAKFKGTDIDKPRNLAKSVTVE